jgi:hypothetical protein
MVILMGTTAGKDTGLLMRFFINFGHAAVL